MSDEAEQLRARGYNGLVWNAPPPSAEACGCGVDDLRPCGQAKGESGCYPARRDEDTGLFHRTWKRRVLTPTPTDERQERGER